MTSSDFGQPSDKAVVWRIVSRKFGGKLYIDQLELNAEDSGTAVMEKLRGKYQALKSQRPYQVWDKTLIFWSPVIETAALSANSTCDLEAQQENRQVFTIHRIRDSELTAAFYNPSILSNTRSFVRDNMRFACGGVEESLEKQILLIGLCLNWIGFLFLILINIILCFGPGLVVGIWTKRVDLGVAVASFVAAVIAFVQQMFIFLRHK